MKEIFKTIGILSGNRVTVLIEGETGTGKELRHGRYISTAPAGTSPLLPSTAPR